MARAHVRIEFAEFAANSKVFIGDTDVTKFIKVATVTQAAAGMCHETLECAPHCRADVDAIVELTIKDGE